MREMLNLENVLINGEEKNKCGTVLLYLGYRNLCIGTVQPRHLTHALYCSVL